jgi:hypothetical protein
LFDLPRDLIPQLLDEPSPLVGRKHPKGLNDLLGIHPRVPSDHDGIADEQ